MTTRRSRRKVDTLAGLVDNLPARFREPEASSVADLRAYTVDLSEHLRAETGRVDPPTVDVMTALGIPPSEWYRALMTAPTTPGDTHGR